MVPAKKMLDAELLNVFDKLLLSESLNVALLSKNARDNSCDKIECTHNKRDVTQRVAHIMPA